MAGQKYGSDYEFNKDLYDTSESLVRPVGAGNG